MAVFLFKFHPMVPEDIYDPDWNGVDSETDRTCKCGKPPRRYVVCDRERPTDTGRKFLACGHENTVCDFLEWIDGEHKSILLQGTLIHLWCEVQATEDLKGREKNARREQLCNQMCADTKIDLKEIMDKFRSIAQRLVEVGTELHQIAQS